MRLFIANVLADALAPSLARWSLKRERQIMEAGQPLDSQHLSFASELGIRSPDGIRVHLSEQVPVPIPAGLVTLASKFGLPVFHPSGMALGRGIAATSDEPELIRHEIVHLSQYQRLGGHPAFMRAYLFECIAHGYRQAPMEVEARRLSTI